MLTNIPFYNGLLGKTLYDNKKAQNAHILIYGAIVVHAMGEKGCIASNERIAKECGYTKHTVSKSISDIAKAGWVNVIMDNFDRKEIIPLLTINVPSDKEDKTTGRGGCPHSMRGVSLDVEGGVPVGKQRRQLEDNKNTENIPVAKAQVISKNKYSPEEIKAYTEIFDSYETNGIQTKDTKNKWFSVKSQKDAAISLFKESGEMKKALLYTELIGKILKFRLENSNPQEDEKRKYFELYNLKVPVTPYELMKNFTQYRITLRKCAIQLSEKNV